MRNKKPSDKILSELDKLVWNKYIQNVIPLKKESSPREVQVQEPHLKQPSTIVKASLPIPVRVSTASSPLKPKRISLRSRTVKKLNLQAVLDLHGFTENQAYYQVIDFLKRSQAAGLREVLIITGKGHFSSHSCHSANSKGLGVLKKALPRWIQEDPLDKIVFEYATSPQKHGGEGATYLFLRRILK